MFFNKKNFLSVFLLLSILGTINIYAADTEQDFNDARTKIITIQATDPSLPSTVSDQKGSIGYVLSRMFDSNGKIGNWFLKVLGTRSDNAVLRWNGGDDGQLVEGSIFDDGTNVGIGTSNPGSKLELVGGDLTIRANSNDAGDLIFRENDNFQLGRIWTNSAANISGLNLSSGDNTADIRINNSGDVGIGNVNPNYDLDVSGDINFTGDLYKNGVLANFSGKFQDGSTAGEVFYNGGNVGIGLTNPNYALDVSGTINATNLRGDGSQITNINGDSIADGTIGSSEVLNNSISENDISDSFIARNSNLLDGIDSSGFLRSNANDTYDNGTLLIRANSVDGNYWGQGLEYASSAWRHTNDNSYGSFFRNGANEFRIGVAGEAGTDGSVATIQNFMFQRDGDLEIPGQLIANGGISGDSITDGTIDSTEIQNNTLTADDLAANSVGNSELQANLSAGQLSLTNTSDVTLTSTANALTIGSTSGDNIAIDGNEIQARNNGATSTLNLQLEGGNVAIGGTFLHDSGRHDTDFVVRDRDKGTVDNPIWYDYSSGRTYLGNQGGAGSEAEVTIRGQAQLGVEGTDADHLVTKNYVDTLVTQGVSWKAPVPAGSTPAGTHGACNASREGWVTYNESDDIIYLCNATAWISIGSSASIPNATTTTAGKVQLSGDIGGTWNNVTINANAIDSSKIANNTITETDISDAFVARNSNLLDGIDSANFVRSNASDNLTGNYAIWGTDTTGNYANSPIEIREIGLVGNTQSSKAYAPAVAWHWGNTTQGQLALESDGVFRFRHGTTHTTLRNVEANAFIGNGSSLTNIAGDNITDGTIDGSEIEDNTLTASDLANNSVGNAELIDNPTVSKLTSTANGDNEVILEYDGGYDLIKQISTRGAIQISSSDDSFYIGNGDVAHEHNSSHVNVESEDIFLASDGNINFLSDLQEGWGTHHTMTFNNAGNLTVPGTITANGGINGDSITDGTIDSTEIQDNTITANDLANNSVGNAELVDDISVNTIGSINIISGDFGEMMRSTDEFLRLNHDGSHTSGVYTPSSLRADGGFRVGSVGIVGADAWIEGDRIRQNTIDGSEIQDNTLTASDLAANSVGSSEIINTQSYTMGGLTVNNTTYATGYGRTAHNNGHLIGSYNNVGNNQAQTNPIYTIGSNYNPTSTALSNMYGIGYTNGNSVPFVLGNASGWGMYVASDGDARAFISGGSGGNSYFAANGGHVGIGTSSPSSALHVLDTTTSQPTALIQQTGASPNLALTDATDGIRFEYNSGANELRIQSATSGGGYGGATVATFERTGNVGIATTTPGERLSVNGRISVTTDPNSGDDVGDRDYNDARYVNVGEGINGDSITDGTIDSSEIQDNTLTASDLATNSVGNSELADTVDIHGVSGVSFISGNFGAVINSYDEWLRLNNGREHTNGIYTPGLFRADDGFNVDGITMVGSDAWIEGDRIRQNTIDGSEIQDNTLTANDLAANSVGNSELIDVPTFSRIGLGITPAGNLASGNTIAIGDGDTGLKQQGDGMLAIFTNNIERLRVENTGDVGIGTTNPGERLSVNGRISVTGNPNSGDDVGDRDYNDNRYNLTCDTITWNNGFELTSAEKSAHGLGSNRFMIHINSVGQRCRDLGYEFGSPQRVFSGWCGFSNADVASYRMSGSNGANLGWDNVSCSDEIAIERAICCKQ